MFSGFISRAVDGSANTYENLLVVMPIDQTTGERQERVIISTLSGDVRINMSPTNVSALVAELTEALALIDQTD